MRAHHGSVRRAIHRGLRVDDPLPAREIMLAVPSGGKSSQIFCIVSNKPNHILIATAAAFDVEKQGEVTLAFIARVTKGPSAK
jgi:hypothetical protein